MTTHSFNLRCELQGHSKDVRCLTETFVPERAVVSGSRDFSVKIWAENQDHQYCERHCLKGHKNFVGAVVSMSPCVQYPLGLLFSGSNDKTIRAYAGDPPEFLYGLDGHSEPVCSLAVDNRRRLLISGSFDKTARIWSVKDCVCVLSGHEHTVWSVLVVPEDEDNQDCAEFKSKLPLVLTGSADKLIRLWKDGKCVRSFLGHTDCVRSLAALSPFEFLSSSNDCTIRRWNLLTGDSITTYSGHENFVYSIAARSSLDYFVSGGEDRTFRVWQTRSGTCLQTLVMPAQSVWSVFILSNGDIVCGSSDGVVRIFTENEKRFADKDAVEIFDQQVAAYGNVHQSSDELGGVKIADLPGKEALHQIGQKEGQTKMIRVGKNVEVYAWSEQKYTWEKVGDVLSAKEPSEGKKMYMGKEYDFVFDVDVEDGKPALKLPYNMDEDPWHAAQKFIHDNMLPQVYLDEVVTFIRNNAPGAGSTAPIHEISDPFTGSGRYVPSSEHATRHSETNVVDPFTGGGRYVPGSQPNVSFNGTGDPLTGSGRYQPTGGAVNWDCSKLDPKRPRGEHIPLNEYILFTITANAMLEKLNESNAQVPSELRLSDEQMMDVEHLVKNKTWPSKNSLDTLTTLLKWPKDHAIPALDVFRLALLTEFVADHFFRPLSRGLDLADHCCRLIGEQTAPFRFKILVCRIFANAFAFPSGRQCVQTCAADVAPLIVERCVCSEKSAVQIAAAATLANFSLCFMEQSNAPKKLEFARKFFDKLKLVEQLGFSLLEQQCLFYLLQALVTLLWGDDEVIELSKKARLSDCVAKIKDATNEESGKNIARSIERMFL